MCIARYMLSPVCLSVCPSQWWISRHLSSTDHCIGDLLAGLL